jgi:ubiquinone/menaquinone biosynthesis C-methylase UbiE
MTESQRIEKIRQQYECEPYPNIPIEKSARDDLQELYLHNSVNPYYLRNQKILDPKDTVILDAGCGSGYSILILAEANPGSHIVGIDLSEESINVARRRLAYHNIENVELYAMSLEDLPSLGMKFDYINNDEVLYLLPDSVAGLKAMKAVLKPDGIIRTNLHSILQREKYYRAQNFCQEIGLMDNSPSDLEVELLQETMAALKNTVNLKNITWISQDFDKKPRGSLTNHLLQGDKGYTIEEMFYCLRKADLEFIRMTRWRTWNLIDLFQDREKLPAFWISLLPKLSNEDKLCLFELLHPVHRLIDFWCGHPDQSLSYIPIQEWSLKNWQSSQIHLHPQLKTDRIKDNVVKSMTQMKSVDLSQYLPIPGLSDPGIDSSTIACLLPLWEGSQSTIDLAKRWYQIRPVDPITLEEISLESAFETVTQILSTMVEFGYVLAEREA